MSRALHRKVSTRRCDFLPVRYDATQETFAVTVSLRQEYHFADRKACERFLSHHYQMVRNLLDAGCHE